MAVFALSNKVACSASVDALNFESAHPNKSPRVVLRQYKRPRVHAIRPDNQTGPRLNSTERRPEKRGVVIEKDVHVSGCA